MSMWNKRFDSPMGLPLLEPLENRLLLSATLQTLGTFNGFNGLSPSGVVVDGEGNLFGTTVSGSGINSGGTIFEWTKSTGQISTLSLFSGFNGTAPVGGVIRDAGGDLFGETQSGTGLAADGTIFERVQSSGALTTLAFFSGFNGRSPVGGLVMDGAGDLFGTTTSGGLNNLGTVFEWVKSTGLIVTLASFSSLTGAAPAGGLTMDAGGDLFGTTTGGGTGINPRGTVFEWVKSTGLIATLASFNGLNGSGPQGGVILGGGGNLFGTTSSGGANNAGEVFEWVKSTGLIAVLGSFNGTNGSGPLGGLVMDGGGDLFGTVSTGAASNAGAVFEWVKSTGALVDLSAFNGSNGRGPATPLALSGDNLFGTTQSGGPTNQGVLFDLTTTATATGSPPTASVTTPSGTLVNNISVAYSLKDPESDPASILVQFSTNGGATFATATAGPGGDGTTGLTTSPAGVAHTFVWNSFADLGAGAHNVMLRITPSDKDGTGAPATTALFRVTAHAFVDVTGVFGTTWTLPSTIVANKPLSGVTSVVVENLGNVALPAGQLVTIQMVARDTTNPSKPDITLAELRNQSISALAANGSATFLLNVSLAGGLPADSYQILANLLPTPALVESTPNQQVSLTADGQTKTVTALAAVVDLAGQFSPALKLPATDISGDGKQIFVPVIVSNAGNVALPAGQKINIQIEAGSGGVVTLLKTLTGLSVSALAPGHSLTFTTNVTLPQSLVTGTYNLVAVVDSSDQVIGDTNRANNTATSSGTIAVTQGFSDLSASKLGASTLLSSVPASTPIRGSVSVTVRNSGNLALPAGQNVAIQLEAYDTTHPTNAPVALAVTDLLPVSSLAVGATRSFTVTVNRSAGLPADTYQIVAFIVPAGNLPQFTAGIYAILTNAVGNPLFITVT
jgi:uncharacterized repeat protein (TIGR03803 family)